VPGRTAKEAVAAVMRMARQVFMAPTLIAVERSS
jgi:hypothetical protein